MSKRLRVNVIFSFLNALVTLLFPLLTYPYVSRVLQPEGIGTYNIAFSVMSYFMLFANLGIPVYAVRAVAKARNNPDELKRTSASIVFLHAVSTAVVFGLYTLYVCLASKSAENFWVGFITGFHIISLFLNVEWFYQGKEEYGAITLKNFIVKVFSLILIFIFVKDTDDVVIYAVIMILSVLIYGIFNFIHFLFAAKPRLEGSELKTLLKPVLLCFALYAASRLASGLDVIMIDGLLGDSAEYVAGQYGVATKFVNVIIDLLLVVNTVMLPRLSLQIKNNELEEAKRLSLMIAEIMFLFVLPATIGLIFISKEVTLIFFGELYEPAINTMMVMSGNAFLAVFTNFLGISIIYAYGRDWFTTIAILIGAVVNVVCNLIMIPMYRQFGAAVATVISNGVIFLIEFIGAHKWGYLRYATKNNLKTLIATVLMTACLVVMQFFMNIESMVIGLIVKIAVSVTVYTVSVLLMRHGGIMVFLNELREKFCKKKKTETENKD